MFYPLSSNSWGEEEALVFQKIMEKGRFTMGENVEKFEAAFADKVDGQNTLMVSSGSMANLVGLSAGALSASKQCSETFAATSALNPQ